MIKIQPFIITILILYLNNLTHQQQQSKFLVIDYSRNHQQQQIDLLFKDVQDQYFVDIGAYDPYFLSATQNFITKRWKGLNVDSGYMRLNRFFYLRPDTINLNIAVDKQNKYVTMIQLNQDSLSTIDSQYLQYKKKLPYTFQTIQYDIPTITLKDLCQRYYIKKPLFMNLNIGGNQGRALESNDWENNLCRPQVLVIEASDNKQLNRTSHQQQLKKNKYQFYMNTGYIDIWIQKDKISSYREKALKSKRQNKITYIRSFRVFFEFAHNINKSVDFRHYSPQNQDIYFSICIEGQPIIIQQLYYKYRKYSNFSDQPIAILGYNPVKAKIIIAQDSYKVSDFYIKNFNNMKINVHFWKLELSNFDKNNYQVYILDHQFIPNLNIATKITSSKQILQKELQSFSSFKLIFAFAIFLLFTLVMFLIQKIKKLQQEKTKIEKQYQHRKLRQSNQMLQRL